MHGRAKPYTAYLGPFAAFLGCLLLGQLVSGLFEGRAAWPISEPQYWVDPLQTLLCGALLIHWWDSYELRRPSGLVFSIAIGVVVFFLWAGAQAGLEAVVANDALGARATQFLRWLGLGVPRLEGFRPDFFPSPAANAISVGLRFVRLVVVVPLLEEIFWRGFLLRWLIDPIFESVPVGTYRPWPFFITTIGFCLEHQAADWPAALLTGALYNWVAIRTKSLSACVLAHAITNLLLGLYVMKTGQWGFW
jgi:CAAX prenyl protease-like protein